MCGAAYGKRNIGSKKKLCQATRLQPLISVIERVSSDLILASSFGNITCLHCFSRAKEGETTPISLIILKVKQV